MVNEYAIATNIVAEYAKMSSQKFYELCFFWQTFKIIPKFFKGVSVVFWKRASLILCSNPLLLNPVHEIQM